jgi:excisionase family DNA binding protein
MSRVAFIPSAYTPAQDADRWQCSERHVRNIVSSGELPAFRLGGKLLRIRAEDVEAFECQNGGSQDCGESSASHGTKLEDSGDVIDLEHQIRKRRPASPRLDTRNSRAREAQR